MNAKRKRVSPSTKSRKEARTETTRPAGQPTPGPSLTVPPRVGTVSPSPSSSGSRKRIFSSVAEEDAPTSTALRTRLPAKGGQAPTKRQLLDRNAQLQNLDRAQLEGEPDRADGEPDFPADVPNAYAIRGKYARADREPAVVYFDYRNADLDQAELEKIRQLVKDLPAPDTNITIEGFGSDDERDVNPGDREMLLKLRMEKVCLALAGAGWTGPAELMVQLDNTDPEIDYRQQRRIQIRTPHVSIGRDAAAPDHQQAPQEIPDAIGAGLVKLRQAAQEIRDNRAGAALDRFFPGVHPREALYNLTRMEQQLAELQEAPPTEPDLRPAYRYLTRNAGRASTSGDGDRMLMTFGPETVRDSPVERAATVLHEVSHGTSAVRTKDISYTSSRLFQHLTGEAALRNADSYAFFVLALTDPEHRPSGPPADRYIQFTKEQSRDIAEAVAYLECYLINARQDVRRLYRHAWHQLYSNVDWPHRYTELLEAVRDTFVGDVHSPVRANEDQTLAGIFERMTILTDAVRGARLTFQPAEATRWQGRTVELSDRFFTLARWERTERLLQALVDATVSSDRNLADKYVKMVLDMADADEYGR